MYTGNLYKDNSWHYAQYQIHKSALQDLFLKNWHILFRIRLLDTQEQVGGTISYLMIKIIPCYCCFHLKI